MKLGMVTVVTAEIQGLKKLSQFPSNLLVNVTAREM